MQAGGAGLQCGVGLRNIELMYFRDEFCVYHSLPTRLYND
jgi:hypothetical protein